MVTDRDSDVSPWNDQYEYRAPAVAAIYVPEGNYFIDSVWGQPAIEVVVCYSYRDSTVGNAAWQVGVTALHWRKWGPGEHETDFEEWWTKEPTERFDYTFTATSVLTNPEHNPDIAYNYRNADVFLVFSEFENDENESYIKYRHYIRSTGQIFLAEYYAQALTHNGYDPSLDVGDLLLDLHGLGGETYNMVALTYTAQYHNNHNGYHICANGWDTTAGDGHKYASFSLQNPDHMWQDAGLSCIDIAPYANDTDFATCTYTQVTGVDGFGFITEVIVVNFFGQLADLTDHHPLDDDGEATTDDAMYSSIAIHRETGGQTLASITYVAQHNDGLNQDWWHPRCVRINLSTWGEANNIPVGGLDNDENPWVTGNYNISDIPFQNPGVSTAIMTNNDNLYWAAWANRIEMEPPPTVITAAYGDSAP